MVESQQQNTDVSDRCPFPSTYQAGMFENMISMPPERYAHWPNAWQNLIRYCDLIVEEATNNNVDPAAVAAVIMFESAADPTKDTAAAGEIGLMQIVPSDEAYRFSWARDRPSAQTLYDPQANISYGTGMLADGLERFNGDLREALRLYNGSTMPLSYYADKVYETYLRIVEHS